jgi:hypothetical protein
MSEKAHMPSKKGRWLREIAAGPCSVKKKNAKKTDYTVDISK